jgi:uncharacterized membrane protein YccC
VTGTTIPNIGPRGQRSRLRFGLIALAVAVGLGALLFALDAERGWRALLFAPLWTAALGVFQARDKT